MSQGRARRAPGWRGKVLAGLLGLVFASLGQTQALAPAPVTDNEVLTLLHIAQLSVWVGAPVSLAHGLCAQQAPNQAWLAGHAPTDRQLERLQQHLERCLGQGGELQPGDTASTLTYQPGDRGLLAGARADFDTRLRRLVMLRLGLRACWKSPADSAEQAQCLQRWAGRLLSAEEQRGLLALNTSSTAAH